MGKVYVVTMLYSTGDNHRCKHRYRSPLFKHREDAEAFLKVIERKGLWTSSCKWDKPTIEEYDVVDKWDGKVRFYTHINWDCFTINNSIDDIGYICCQGPHKIDMQGGEVKVAFCMDDDTTDS